MQLDSYTKNTYLNMALDDINHYLSNIRVIKSQVSYSFKRLLEMREERLELGELLNRLETSDSYCEKTFSRMNEWDWSSVPLWSNHKGRKHLIKIHDKIIKIKEHYKNR